MRNFVANKIVSSQMYTLLYKLFENAEGLVAREARVRDFCDFEGNRTVKSLPYIVVSEQ